MENYRIFVEKHPRFRVEADSLRRELNTNLNLDIRSLRLLNVYDLCQIFVGNGIVEQQQLRRADAHLGRRVDQPHAVDGRREAEVKPVAVLEGFTKMTDAELEPCCKRYGLAMNADDLREVVKYFRAEGRDPYETELRILDTYWSDHCRHTTFTTELEGITVEESFAKDEIEDSLALYLRIRRELGREHKSICLMDMATIGARYLRKKGLLDDLEVSDENNACSVYVDVDGRRPRSGSCNSRTKPITTRPRSSRSAVLRPVWAALSATRCRGAATSTRPCA